MPRKPLDAVRTNIYLPKKQDAALRALADHTGVTFVEHLRRAVDFYLAFSEDIQRAVDNIANLGASGERDSVHQAGDSGLHPEEASPGVLVVDEPAAHSGETGSKGDGPLPFRTTVEP